MRKVFGFFALVATLAAPAMAQDTRPIKMVNVNAVRTCGASENPARLRERLGDTVRVSTSYRATAKRWEARGYRVVPFMGEQYGVTGC